MNMVLLFRCVVPDITFCNFLMSILPSWLHMCYLHPYTLLILNVCSKLPTSQEQQESIKWAKWKALKHFILTKMTVLGTKITHKGLQDIPAFNTTVCPYVSHKLPHSLPLPVQLTI
jgi:hypothetical protein